MMQYNAQFQRFASSEIGVFAGMFDKYGALTVYSALLTVFVLAILVMFARRDIGFLWYEKEYKQQVVDLTAVISNQETGALEKLVQKVEGDSRTIEAILSRLDAIQMDLRDDRRGGGRGA